MVAYALEGKQCVYLAFDSRRIPLARTHIEKHLASVEKEICGIHISFANGRYTVDSRGRKGYIQLTTNIRDTRGNQYSEVFADSDVPDPLLAELEARKNTEVRGHGGKGIEQFQSFRGR